MNLDKLIKNTFGMDSKQILLHKPAIIPVDNSCICYICNHLGIYLNSNQYKLGIYRNL